MSPVIIIQPESQIIKNKERNILVFWISATGEGYFNYLWEKYNQFRNSWVPPSSRAEQIQSVNLTFGLITEKDEGIYRCTVRNYDGYTVSDNVTISVYGMLVIGADKYNSIYY